MNRLAQKTAIVTGAAVGIGRACVERMAEEGAQVAIFDVMETEGRTLASDLTAKGHAVAFWRVDVAKEAAMKSAIDAAAARFGGLHVMVNNAGISGSPKPTDQVTEDEWDRVQAVNVKGVMFDTKHVIPHLRVTSPDLEAAKAAAGSVHPIGHMGEPDDIAWAVVWLASDEAKFVTGAEIAIDGGYTAR